MNFKHFGLPILLLGALAMSACSGDEEEGVDAGPKDKGPAADATVTPDTGTGLPDSGFPPQADSGPRDGGGPVDSGTTVVPGTEGGSCTPDPSNEQGDCNAGLICAVWAVDDNTGAATSASCIKECTADADCAGSTAGNTLCRNIALASDPFKICVQQQGADDEFCAASKLGSQPMAGCAEGLDCLLGFFTDLEPYEGLCVKLCDLTGQNPAELCSNANLPYCNGPFVTLTSSSGAAQRELGVCTDGQHRAGAKCQASGLTGRCDFSEDAGDLGCISGLTEAGTGVCFEFCDLSAATPTCKHADPVLGTSVCTSIDRGAACTTDAQCTQAGWDRCAPDGFCGIVDGVCTIDCTIFPENCSGPGENGAGRTCMEGIGFDLDGDGNGTPLDLCLDIQVPELVESKLGYVQGQLDLVQQGDNCMATDADFLRCPDYTACIPVQQDVGLCLRGCNTATTAQDPRGGCETDSTTSTSLCDDEFFGPNGPPVEWGAAGFCTEP